jgi:ribose/xylose/arabinose/galactoside ABC-type transport system permease subunit
LGPADALTSDGASKAAKPGPLASIRDWWSRVDRTAATIYGILATLILLAAVASPSFRTLFNLQNILRQSVALGLVGIGQTFVIIAGGIDISVSSVITLTAVLSAGTMNGQPAMVLPTVLMCLALGILVGLLNGFLVTGLRIPHFVATFGTWSILRGIVLIYTRGPVGLIPRSFCRIASGHLGPIPVPALIFAAFLVLAVIVLRHTTFGRYVRAVGGGLDISRLSGIPVKGVQRMTFLISSVMGVLAGLYLAARMSVGDPNVGAGLEWDSVAAAVIGGADWLGWGSLTGTLAGVLMVTTLSNAMNQLNINFWYQQVFKGLIILLAVVLYRQRK